MSGKNSGKSSLGEPEVRAERRAAALRENLKRRKAQARGRAAIPAAGEGSAAAPSTKSIAGPADEPSRD